ncbi:MAG: hypothetical protein ACI9EW_001635 [Cellvibrionaceae bacterium]|jgi:hypothetical protein
MIKKSLCSLLLLVAALTFIVACTPQTAEEPVTEPEQAAQAETAAEPVVPPTPTLVPTLPPPVISGGSSDAEADAPLPEPEVAADVAVEAPQDGCDKPYSNDSFGYGVQSHAIVGDPAFTMESIKNGLGMEWVKVQLEWRLVQPSDVDRQWFFYDGVVDEANKQGLCLMFSIVGSPGYLRSDGQHNGPPDDYNTFAAFLNELLDRYPGQIHGIEVWNEMNLDREWTTANGVNAADYVRFLQIANDAIKAKDPNVMVISGALAPTGGGDGIAWLDDFSWLDNAIAAGMLNYADCIGVHHNGYNLGPSFAFDQTGASPDAANAIFRGPFDNPHHSWSFKTTIETYASKVKAVDPTKKLCVTEFGWASTEGYDEVPLGFEFAQDNTLDEQAQWLVEGFQQMRNSGDVWLAFVFNYDFGNKGGGPTDDPVPYSIIDVNGIPRPAFGALAAMEKN